MLGSLLVIVSALGFSTLGIFGKMALDDGFSLNQMLFWRFTLALPLIGLLVWLEKARASSPRAFVKMVLFGAVGLGGLANLYFLTLQHFGAALAGIFLYLYPSFVALIRHFYLRKKLNAKQWGCVFLALIGCTLTSGLATPGDGVVSPFHDLPGLLIGVSTGAWYAVYILISDQFLKIEKPISLTFAVLLGGFLSFGLFTLNETPQNGSIPIPSHVHTWLSLLGIAWIASVLPFSTMYLGMKRIGALATSLLATLEIVFTCVLAVIVLHENLAVGQIFGAFLVLLSVLLTSLLARQ